MNAATRFWNAMSRTERWAWLCIIIAAILLTIAYQDLEGVVLIFGAVCWRLIWIALKLVWRVAHGGP